MLEISISVLISLISISIKEASNALLQYSSIFCFSTSFFNLSLSSLFTTTLYQFTGNFSFFIVFPINCIPPAISPSANTLKV